MEFFTEPLSQPFMVRALLAGTAVGAVCALLGVFIVQRGLSFIGDGLAHAAFGGIALGLLLGASVSGATWVALPFTVLVALGIAFVLRRGKIRGDVATGVFFAVSFALGVLFLGLRPASAPPVNVETVLFGSILAVGPADLRIVLGVCAFVVLALGLSWTRMAYATFDPELARLSGVRVELLDYLLLSLAALVIVVAVKTVGIALVSSFMVIPAATARMLGRSLHRVTLYAVGIGMTGASLGLLLSYRLNAASGATIILCLGAAFALAFALRRR
jgi:zinc transport system permease protein